MGPNTTTDLKLPGQSHKAAALAVIFGVLFVLAAVFGYWAFTGRQDYKNNSDKKVATAVSAAQKVQAAKDQANFEQQSKSPYKTFTGSATYGSVSFTYPRTWSAYISQTGSDQPLNGYFYPDAVPSTDSNTAYALRVELVSQDYATVLSDLESSTQDGSLDASAYLPPKLKGVTNAQVGTRLDGAIGQDGSGNTQNGAMVALKVRDKTLKIYTESNTYLADFNNVVLPSLTYNP